MKGRDESVGEMGGRYGSVGEMGGRDGGRDESVGEMGERYGREDGSVAGEGWECCRGRMGVLGEVKYQDCGEGGDTSKVHILYLGVRDQCFGFHCKIKMIL